MSTQSTRRIAHHLSLTNPGWVQRHQILKNNKDMSSSSSTGLMSVLINTTSSSSSSGMSSKASDKVTIGDVSKPLIPPHNLELVPFGLAIPAYDPSVSSTLGASLPLVQTRDNNDNLQFLYSKPYAGWETEEQLNHLHWMMQKDILGQDMFLIGPPGPARRHLALRFAELTQREVEFVSISRDTSEPDLKQRREIIQGSAHHLDQCAVRAALHGRLLIIDGIEKAERNVLPALNNLLENREMTLDDGKFLMHPTRFDELLQTHTKEELEQLNLLRVHDDFRVIAIGLPTPRFEGNPLDPPLRSRFQARDISPPSVTSQIDQLSVQQHVMLNTLKSFNEANNLGNDFKPLSDKTVQNLVALAESLRAIETDGAVKIPYFPENAPGITLQLMLMYPGLSNQQVLKRTFPYRLVLDDTESSTETMTNTMRSFFDESESSSVPYALDSIARLPSTNSFLQSVLPEPVNKLELSFTTPESTSHKVHALGGPLPLSDNSVSSSQSSSALPEFIKTKDVDNILTAMMQDHTIGRDLCLIGEKGSGKSSIIRHFAHRLGYQIETLSLYKDMTARDFIQRRTTTETGDTTWEMTPLVQGAIHGRLVVLDGIDKLSQGQLSFLSRLVIDRELELFDGTRLVRHDRFQAMASVMGMDKETLINEKRIIPVHPSFRIVATSTPPDPKKKNWLTSEIMTMFHFHQVSDLSHRSETKLLQYLFPQMPKETIDQVVNVAIDLRAASQESSNSLDGVTLSTRQLIRICRRLQEYPQDAYEMIAKTCMSKFLPVSGRQYLDSILQKNGIDPVQQNFDGLSSDSIKITQDSLTIDGLSIPRHVPNNEALVPNVLFHDIPQHVFVLKDMLKDYQLDEHLLLLGAQGVGKNKLADKFIGLLNMEKEYIQLHRDTTVQTLTLQPSLKNGRIVWEDSPLIRAVANGRILIVDEADKAPLEVVGYIKTLVEDKTMLLADGRRITNDKTLLEAYPESTIPIHPDFRMFVLGNKPGFPFLGNDFFNECGDIFSCFDVDNPDKASEISLLREYAPDLSPQYLDKLTSAFADLRALVDQGILSYPYSTRELVNLVVHMQKFPNDGLLRTLNNVFAFDSYDDQMKEHVKSVFQKHGIPVGFNPNTKFHVNLAQETPLPPPVVDHNNISSLPSGSKVNANVQEYGMSINGPWKWSKIAEHDNEMAMSRVHQFSEETAHFKIPSEGSALAMTRLANDNSLHVLSDKPLRIHSFRGPDFRFVSHIDLEEIFPFYASPERPSMKFVGSQLVVFSNDYNRMLLVDPWKRECSTLDIPSDQHLDAQGKPSMRQRLLDFTQYRLAHKNQLQLSLIDDQAYNGILAAFRAQQSNFSVFDFNTGSVAEVDLDDANVGAITNMWMPSQSLIWLTTSHGGMFQCDISNGFAIQELNQLAGEVDLQNISGMTWLNSKHFPDAGDSSFVRSAKAKGAFAQMMVDTPSSSQGTRVHSLPRSSSSSMAAVSEDTSVLFNSNGNQLITANISSPVDNETEAIEDHPDAQINLEIVDFARHTLRNIVVPSSSPLLASTKPSFLRSGSVKQMLTQHLRLQAASSVISLVPMDDGTIASLQKNGLVRLWQTDVDANASDLADWRTMVGIPVVEENRMQIEYEYSDGKKPSGDPKVGKPMDGEAHVGGNQFEGGSGGADTAGLGGAGGPFRQDSGFPVHQVPDDVKAAVSQEVRDRARAMAKKAYQDRLNEIEMTEFHAEQYNKIYNSVAKEVAQLRNILEGLEAKSKERVWLKHQTTGDLDDGKLVEGITGTKTIYRRRGDDNEDPFNQEHPKRLRFAVDISGSMYRFNGWDQRLNRVIETTCMIMEALDGFDRKFEYSIVGHSGDGPSIPLIDFGKPPKNKKEIFTVLQKMHAHSQYCMSGDHTVGACESAIKAVTEKEGDDYFAFVISDANLDRYSISGDVLGPILTKDPKVNAYILFIASFSDQADRLVSQLPAGHGFQCLDTADIPNTLRTIFKNVVLKDSS